MTIIEKNDREEILKQKEIWRKLTTNPNTGQIAVESDACEVEAELERLRELPKQILAEIENHEDYYDDMCIRNLIDEIFKKYANLEDK